MDNDKRMAKILISMAILIYVGAKLVAQVRWV